MLQHEEEITRARVHTLLIDVNRICWSESLSVWKYFFPNMQTEWSRQRFLYQVHILNIKYFSRLFIFNTPLKYLNF